MQPLRIFLLFTLCLVFGFAGATEVEVITLKYRSAEQVLPVIRPLVAAGGSVSGMQNQLILRSTKANLKELKKVLDSLDTMPRRLMIYVRQDLDTANAQRDAQVTGSVDTQGVQGVAARIYESRGASGEGISQKIQVLEGNPAYIEIGKSVPVSARTVTRTVSGPIVTDSVAYRDLTAGFEVVPRVSGERVFLDISPRRDTPVGNRGGADLQHMVSSVSGRLGEWLELGASSRDDTRSDAGLLIGAAGLRKEHRSVWVKVEELN